MFRNIVTSILNIQSRKLLKEISRSTFTGSKWRKDTLEQFWMRRQILGPDKLRPRSDKPNWNYDAELFAFGCRLNETFNMETLRSVFLFRSHLERDLEIRAAVSGDSESAEIKASHNEAFIEKGRLIVQAYTKAFLRFYYPSLPEEGIKVIADYLNSDDCLAEISVGIGTKDLIYSTEFPASSKTLADVFFAVVGGLEKDSGIEKAERFVQDFVLTKLNDMDVNEIFNVAEPQSILEAVLKSRGKGAPEPRLLRQAGSFTVTPIFIVGIYSDKQLLGQSPGESVAVATEMAYRESLKLLWATTDRHSAYDFDSYRNLDAFKPERNGRLADLTAPSSTPAGGWSPVDAVEPEPLAPELLLSRFKTRIEPTFGVTLRRRLKHHFYKGTPMRKVPRSFIKPKVETI